MKLITQISDLSAVSGGYYDYAYDEYVTADAILYHSLSAAALWAFFSGSLGVILGHKIAQETGALLLGTLAGVAGAYVGWNYNQYTGIKPNTWVTWEVTYY